MVDDSPRILLTRKWPGAVEDRLSGRSGVTLNRDDRPMSANALAEALRHFEILCPTVSDRLDAAPFAQEGLRTRLICNYGAGHDHIDLEACARHGIIVTNTPDVLSDATAELALLLMLMVARRAGEGERELRAGAWSGWRPTHMMGTLVTGKRLGIIGFGRTGQAMAAKARGLDMDILYHGRRRADAAVEARLGARHIPDLDDLLADSDFVSLHCPGGTATHHLIDGAALARMRPTAFLINTARGSVVDESALADALRAGRIAGAALDVYQGEPAIAPALLAAPNLVMLPHLGSATTDTRIAMGMRALDNLDAWLAGREPPDRIA